MRRVPTTTPENDARITRYFADAKSYNAADHHSELFDRHEYPDDPLIRLTSAQDYVALMGQGVVTDRNRELLGRSDMGVAFLRRLFLRELAAIEQGKPTKTWTPMTTPVDMPIPVRSPVNA